MTALAGSAVAVLAALVVGGGFWWQELHEAPPPGWQGFADADYVRVGPTLGGQLVSLSVHRGDQVAAGAPLFAQDEADDLAACNQAAASLAEAQARLTNLENAGRETEISMAQADLADMRATRDRIAKDLARNQQLLRSGAATQQTVDQQSAELDSAVAHVKASEAKLAPDPTGYRAAIRDRGAARGGRAAACGARTGRLAAGTAQSHRAGGGSRCRHLRPAWRDDAGRRSGGGTAAAEQHVGAVLRSRRSGGWRRSIATSAWAIACDSCAPDLTARISVHRTGQPEYTPGR